MANGVGENGIDGESKYGKVEDKIDHEKLTCAKVLDRIKIPKLIKTMNDLIPHLVSMDTIYNLDKDILVLGDSKP